MSDLDPKGNLNYGVIGNGKSAALVSESGSIDWCCLPAFDSPSIFARILDDSRGGHFGVSLEGQTDYSQAYLPRTNILITTLSDGENALEIHDFMPRYKTRHGGYHCPPDVIRILKPVQGSPRIRIDYDPRLGYSEFGTTTIEKEGYLKSTTQQGPYESVYLYSDLDLNELRLGAVMDLESEHFVLISYNQKIVAHRAKGVALEYERTNDYWISWADESTYPVKYREAIERSALVLKLLAYQKSGAVVAALTTSLPEEPGGERNWDYRFCWLRDASMIIKTFTRLGHYRVGARFLQFILDVIPYKDETIQIMYGIDRQKELEERTLPWLTGYENSQPVRIGNAAYSQKQNDIYGVVMDTIYQRLVTGPETSTNLEDLWTVVRSLARNVERHWHQPDAGIWEIRGGRKHFTFSKVLCWVAIDRAIKIATIFDRIEYVDGWTTLRDHIKQEVMERGFNAALGCFTQSYDDTSLDAANLLFEPYGFIDADDPAYIGTVELSYERLCTDGLMYRYRNADDFGSPKSSFTVCTFWMIKSLARIGQQERATQMFEDLLEHSNHLGLFSEDMEFESKRLLGNFPQGYSHLALIDTAMTLSEAE